MFSENARTVLEKRYLQRNLKGEIVETVEGLFRRVAKAVARSEACFLTESGPMAEIEEQFFQAMINRRFLPNSPTLMNAGKERGQLSACFVLPVPDSLEGIFETCKNAALIHKTGGGTGFSFSRLRPMNDPVATTSGVASGPVSFMTVYDAATEAIRQGGTRRGANMGILVVDHPDIEDFVRCKRDTGRLNNFNISVAVNDSFMQAVANDQEYELRHPGTGEVVRRVKARRIFNLIVESAHATGEPGIVFLDRINAGDPLIESFDSNGGTVPGTEDIEATNPCGEQPLGPNDACNLGSINLTQFINKSGSDFDWESLGDMVQLAVRFLDDIVEANSYPLEFIRRAALGNRRIGLGVMGWAEALILIKLSYGSDDALAKAEELMSFINGRAHQASSALACARGNFPNWQFSTWAQLRMPMRNATVTTIAPTGTISMIAGCSSGIEPIFAVSYVRRVLSGMELIEVNPLFEKIAKERGFYREELMKLIAEEGTVQHLPGIPDDVKRLFVCAHDLDYRCHVKMQAAFQKWTDCAVSKTINFPQDATVDDVGSAYWMAYELGLKGITVYRDATRRSQVLNIGRSDPQKKESSADPPGTVTSPRRSRASLDSLGAAISSILSNVPAVSRDGCFECGLSAVAYREACLVCHSCGYTKC